MAFALRAPAYPVTPATDEGRAQGRIAVAVLVVLGLGSGLSPFLSDYYDATSWVPIGLGLVVLAAVALIARPERLRGAGALAIGGLLGLGAWSLASTAWAESVENAIVDGDRLLVYGALLVLLVTLLPDERRSAFLLGAAGAGVLAVALSVLARLLGGHPGSLFALGRLSEPLGYVNGEGCLFVIGLWLCWSVAERERPAVAGAGAGAATLMACLALLSQSRGTALALAASVLAVVLVAPDRRRRLLGLTLVAVGVALARGPLLAVYHHDGTAGVPVGVAHAAGWAALLASLGVGAVWTAASSAQRRLIAARPERAVSLRRAGSVALAALALVGATVVVASAPRIGRSVTAQWRAFTHLAPGTTAGGAAAADTSQSRLLSGAGNRYDYWRIAWDVWRSHPIIGVGAGNYSRFYFVARATDEDILQPHSLELQVLAELGLIGAALLAAFLAGLAASVRSMRRGARESSLTRALLVAALGAVVAWLVQTSVDWMHLLPGLTAIVLAAMAVVLAGGRIAGRSRERGVGVELRIPPARPSRWAPPRLLRPLRAVVVFAVLALAGGSLARQGLADRFRARAARAVATDPSVAVREANSSLGFDAAAVTTYYVKAAALARLDEAVAARAALTTALAREPQNFVTLTLLGDIASRRGLWRAARADYARAHRLNPRDRSLASLMINPRASVP